MSLPARNPRSNRSRYTRSSSLYSLDYRWGRSTEHCSNPSITQLKVHASYTDVNSKCQNGQQNSTRSTPVSVQRFPILGPTRQEMQLFFACKLHLRETSRKTPRSDAPGRPLPPQNTPVSDNTRKTPDPCAVINSYYRQRHSASKPLLDIKDDRFNKVVKEKLVISSNKTYHRSMSATYRRLMSVKEILDSLRDKKLGKTVSEVIPLPKADTIAWGLRSCNGVQLTSPTSQVSEDNLTGEEPPSAQVRQQQDGHSGRGYCWLSQSAQDKIKDNAPAKSGDVKEKKRLTLHVKLPTADDDVDQHIQRSTGRPCCSEQPLSRRHPRRCRTMLLAVLTVGTAGFNTKLLFIDDDILYGNT